MFALLMGTDWPETGLPHTQHLILRFLSSFQAGRSYEQLKEELGDAAALTRIAAVSFLEEQVAHATRADKTRPCHRGQMGETLSCP